MRGLQWGKEARAHPGARHRAPLSWGRPGLTLTSSSLFSVGHLYEPEEEAGGQASPGTAREEGAGQGGLWVSGAF